MANSSENALVTKRDDGRMVVALWNYAEPHEKGADKSFQLKASGIRAKKYRMQSVGPGNASSLEAWIAMGSPAYPTASQIKDLIKASQLTPAKEYSVAKPITLAPQTLAILELER